VTTLSKSKYLAGCQCPKRLWLACFEPELATEAGAADQGQLEMGQEIGRHAHALFPGGMLVEEEAWRHGEAIARTRAVLEDSSVPAIFEAAFEHDGIRIRVDVLERLAESSWGLREVKSTTSVKEVHLDDLAVQRFVLERCGLRVHSTELIHVNRDFVRGEGPIDWRSFFSRVELATEVTMRLAAVPERIAVLRSILAQPVAPGIEPSPHCFVPRACEFWEHCTREKPADWILYLPRLGASRFAELRAAGIECIADVPDNVPLTRLQARARDVHRSGRPFVASELADALADTGPPGCYLDFETINPAVPLYSGTGPYEPVPVQWSLHRVDRDGRLGHGDFLAREDADPRRPFAETLLAALAHCDGPIVVYSSFERRILEALRTGFPDLAEPLADVLSRLVDLLPVVRRHLYHAEFGGSFSLKSVGPALVPGLGYGDLDGITNGGEASTALLQLALGRVTDGPELERLRHALRAYCGRDTEALLRLHRRLQELCLEVG